MRGLPAMASLACGEPSSEHASCRALSLTECPACDARAQQVEALQCPICMQLSTDKIFQCTSGHLICARCLPRLAAPPRCPTCREPLPRTRIRSLAAEQQGPSPNRSSPGLRHLFGDDRRRSCSCAAKTVGARWA